MMGMAVSVCAVLLILSQSHPENELHGGGKKESAGTYIRSYLIPRQIIGSLISL